MHADSRYTATVSGIGKPPERRPVTDVPLCDLNPMSKPGNIAQVGL
jgi:hypothetical protein